LIEIRIFGTVPSLPGGQIERPGTPLNRRPIG